MRKRAFACVQSVALRRLIGDWLYWKKRWAETYSAVSVWLRSPIQYVQHERFALRLRQLAEQHLSFDSAYYHYVSMAKKNCREHLLGEIVRYKKYLYVLRPQLAARWIREGLGAPPMVFAELAQVTLHDPALISEINRLLEVKMRAGEAATSPRWDGIHAFILSELEVAQAYAPSVPRKRDAAELDGLLREAVTAMEV